MKLYLLWSEILFSGIICLSQTVAEKTKIAQTYNREYLKRLADRLKKQADKEKSESLRLMLIIENKYSISELIRAKNFYSIYY